MIIIAKGKRIGKSLTDQSQPKSLPHPYPLTR